MSKSKPYSAVAVNHVLLEQLTKGRDGLDVIVGSVGFSIVVAGSVLASFSSLALSPSCSPAEPKVSASRTSCVRPRAK